MFNIRINKDYLNTIKNSEGLNYDLDNSMIQKIEIVENKMESRYVSCIIKTIFSTIRYDIPKKMIELYDNDDNFISTLHPYYHPYETNTNNKESNNE